MAKTPNLSEEQIEQIINEVEDITLNNGKSVEELYAVIGNSIHYSSDFRLAQSSSKSLLEKIDTTQPTITLAKAMSLLSGSSSLTHAAAIEGGSNLWGRIKDKVKKIVCSNEIIKKFFTQGGSLKDAVKTLIPIIIGALGISAINPFLLAAIVAIISLIIKEGYSRFCEI